MTSALTTRIAASVFTASIFAFGHGATSANAASTDYCHNYYVTGKTASATTRSKAEQRARGKWSEKAVSVKGGRWGDWSIARQKGYICWPAGLIYCKAKAVPCLYRKTSSGNGTQKPIN